MVLGPGADFGILIQIEGFYTAKIGISARLELSGADEVDYFTAAGYASYGKTLVFSEDNREGICVQY